MPSFNLQRKRKKKLYIEKGKEIKNKALYEKNNKADKNPRNCMLSYLISLIK